MGTIKNFRILLFCLGLLLPFATTKAAGEADAPVLLRDAETSKLNFSDLRGSKPGEEAASAVSGASMRTIGFWLLLFGVAAGATTVYYKRRYSAACIGQKGRQLALLERLSVGPQRELLLLKACDRLLVVGCQGNQLSLLSDLPAEDSPSQPFHNLLPRQSAVEPPGSAWAGLVEKLHSPRQEVARTPAAVSAAYAWPEAENAQ